MLLDRDTCYHALLSHDRRFDGQFFVGVSSTRIYCRPICNVRTPKYENCHFFASAASAEHAGYRPCLKCRPELAPGLIQPIDNRKDQLAQAAAHLIDGNSEEAASLPAIARKLGLSERHLRRIFQDYWGVSPIAYTQTRKLLLAKQLLTETQLPITAVAFAAGFSSLSRFNALFRTRYRLSPSQLRKRTKQELQGDTLALSVGYRPPFNWHALLEFLAKRAIPGVEYVTEEVYTRTVSLTHRGQQYNGWIRVYNKPRHARLIVEIPDTLSPAAAIILNQVRHIFDTDSQPVEIGTHLKELADSDEPGIRVPGAFDGFEMAVRAILGQRITVAASTTLAGRLASTYGKPLSTPFAELTVLFPEAGTIVQTTPARLSELGISQARAQTMCTLAHECIAGKILLTRETDVHATIAALQAIPGIGEWTAQYIAMRALGWPDAFPADDYGVKKALGETHLKAVIEKSKGWQPWRAYAVMYLWRSLQQKEQTI